MKKLKCASFFAGVGGIDIGFEQTNLFDVIYANEFDKFPVTTYENNFNIKVDCRDIRDVSNSEIPNFDVMLAGFPCQAFSIAGYRKGFNDEKGRGTLFFELVRIIKEKQPSIIFLENVKNLVGHDKGNTFSTILEELEKENYFIKYSVLNAMDYGNVPQNRERIYIVAFKDEKIYRYFDFPKPIRLTTKLSDVIDFNSQLDEKYYYRKDKYKGNIYELLVEAMDDENAIYQWRRKYVRKNKSGVIPTLTANQGEGGHNVCLIKTKNGIRKMTPHECFNAQGFPYNFNLPNELSDTRLYKQAGNSVCVSVIFRIAEQIKYAYIKSYCKKEKYYIIETSNKLPNDAMNIRQGVFVEEQGFVDEFDDTDKISTHLVCYDGDKAIGTGRVFYDEKFKGYHIGRVAVIKSYRGKGIGREILEYAEKIVKEKGGKSLSLSAQVRASGFYEKLGYTKQGEEYLDEYCPHIFMIKDL